MHNEHHDVEVHLEHAKEAVAFGEAIQRLIRNKDFQLVIDEGYTNQEARRLTLLLGDPMIESKDATITSLRAIGEFHQFIRMRLAYAEQMQMAIDQYREDGNQSDGGEEAEEVIE